MTTYPGDLRDLVDPDWRDHQGFGVYIYCPAHTDVNRPSMRVYERAAHCFTCGTHLKRREFSELFTGKEQTAALIHAAGYSKTKPKPREQIAPGRLAILAHDMLTMEQYDYLENRGISSLTVELYGIGHYGPAYTLPVFDLDGNIITVRFRRDDELNPPADMPKYWGMAGMNQTLLYPTHGRIADPVIVLTEGEFDALLLRRRGFPAYSFTNGNQALPKAEELEELFGNVETVVLVRDQDKAGREGSELLTKRLPEHIEVKDITWQLEKGKDITALWQQDIDEFKKVTAILKEEVVPSSVIAQIERHYA